MKQELVERELTKEGPRRAPGVGRKRRSVTVNLGESPLSWLHARGHLDDRLFAAGEALRRDFERAQITGGRLTMNWDATCAISTSGGGTTGLHASEKQLAAKERFDGALLRAGKGLSDVLWRVVCAGEGLPDAEKALEWPARSGKLVLKLALDRVADFYQIR